MTIIEKIKQSVEGATGVPFLYHAAGELNELIARCNELPIAYSFLIENGAIDDVNGRYHERVTIAVIFCDKTEFDFNAIENEQIIDRMKVKAYKWLQSLRMSNALRVVSVNNTQRLYDNTTDVLTGYAINITIEDVAGVGECELPEVVFDVDKNGSYDVVGVDKVRVNVVPKMEELEVTQNGEYLPPTDIAGFSKVSVDIHPVLEELTVTADGEYTPQDGVDGFSKVVAEFDISSLPKVKVTSYTVSDACLNNGIFDNRLIDFSEIRSMSNMFIRCTNLLGVAEDIEFTNKVTNIQGMFCRCQSLHTINTTKFDTSNVTNVLDAFVFCTNLKYIDCTGWDFSKVTTSKTCFYDVYRLKSLIGNRTIEDVLENNISCFKNAKNLHSSFIHNAPLIDRASLRAVINGLADLTGQTAQTLTLGATLIAKLTEEDIAIATNKNWTIA